MIIKCYLIYSSLSDTLLMCNIWSQNNVFNSFCLLTQDFNHLLKMIGTFLASTVTVQKVAIDDLMDYDVESQKDLHS